MSPLVSSPNPTPPIAANSTEQGFLAPTNTYGALDDQALARFIQQMVAGITGLDQTLVRPAWQPEPPDEPPFETTWCSVRSAEREPDTFAFEGTDQDNNHLIIRHELVNLVAEFQGPQSESMAETLSLGFQVAQNREYLTRAGYGFVESGKPVILPVIRNERWLYVVDLPFTLRRRQQSSYTVEQVATAVGDLLTDVPAGEYPLTVKP